MTLSDPSVASAPLLGLLQLLGGRSSMHRGGGETVRMPLERTSQHNAKVVITGMGVRNKLNGLD